MAAPWIELQIEFCQADFLHLYFARVPPSEAPLQAIYGALFLGKLIRRTRRGRGPHARACPDSFGRELLRHTRSILKRDGGGVIPRAPRGLSRQSIADIILIITAPPPVLTTFIDFLLTELTSNAASVRDRDVW